MTPKQKQHQKQQKRKENKERITGMTTYDETTEMDSSTVAAADGEEIVYAAKRALHSLVAKITDRDPRTAQTLWRHFGTTDYAEWLFDNARAALAASLAEEAPIRSQARWVYGYLRNKLAECREFDAYVESLDEQSLSLLQNLAEERFGLWSDVTHFTLAEVRAIIEGTT